MQVQADKMFEIKQNLLLIDMDAQVVSEIGYTFCAGYDRDSERELKVQSMHHCLVIAAKSIQKRAEEVLEALKLIED